MSGKARDHAKVSPVSGVPISTYLHSTRLARRFIISGVLIGPVWDKGKEKKRGLLQGTHYLLVATALL